MADPIPLPRDLQSTSKDILSMLPGLVLIAELAGTLQQHEPLVSQYCQLDMTPIIERIMAEDGIPNSVLHDHTKYKVIRFHYECVPLQRLGEKGVGINVQNVVASLRRALDILDAGGFGISDIEGNQHLPDLLMRGAHLTLDLNEKMRTVHPALRYKHDIDEITNQDVDKIVEVIRKGRAQIKARQSAFEESPR